MVFLSAVVFVVDVRRFTNHFQVIIHNEALHAADSVCFPTTSLRFKVGKPFVEKEITFGFGGEGE